MESAKRFGFGRHRKGVVRPVQRVASSSLTRKVHAIRAAAAAASARTTRATLHRCRRARTVVPAPRARLATRRPRARMHGEALHTRIRPKTAQTTLQPDRARARTDRPCRRRIQPSTLPEAHPLAHVRDTFVFRRPSSGAREARQGILEVVHARPCRGVQSPPLELHARRHDSRRLTLEIGPCRSVIAHVEQRGATTL